MKKISLIIPAYNEERRIGKMLENYSYYFEKLRKNKKLDYELIVVINNTTDKTDKIVNSYIKKNERIFCLNFERGGKGFAVIEGFKHALKKNNDFIGFVDADMATPPEQYFKLIEKINNVDGVIADRYLNGSKIYPAPSWKRIAARKLFNFVIRSFLLIPYGDTQCGAKVFRRKAIEKIINSIGMSNWAFDVDLLYNLKKNGFRIIPCKTLWYDKEYSKINFWKAGPWMALAIVRLRILNSPFQRFIRIYDKLIGYIP